MGSFDGAEDQSHPPRREQAAALGRASSPRGTTPHVAPSLSLSPSTGTRARAPARRRVAAMPRRPRRAGAACPPVRSRDGRADRVTRRAAAGRVPRKPMRGAGAEQPRRRARRGEASEAETGAPSLRDMRSHKAFYVSKSIYQTSKLHPGAPNATLGLSLPRPSPSPLRAVAGTPGTCPCAGSTRAAGREIGDRGPRRRGEERWPWQEKPAALALLPRRFPEDPYGARTVRIVWEWSDHVFISQGVVPVFAGLPGAGRDSIARSPEHNEVASGRGACFITRPCLEPRSENRERDLGR
ncbi:hypothetical protein JHW43_009277 [Diplocarpon mali]|nr:hypothetical protein JHW43_009277 [Diplocarpon mali]